MLIIPPGTEVEAPDELNRVKFHFPTENDAILFWEWIKQASRTGAIIKIKIVRKKKEKHYGS